MFLEGLSEIDMNTRTKLVIVYEYSVHAYALVLSEPSFARDTHLTIYQKTKCPRSASFTHPLPRATTITSKQSPGSSLLQAVQWLCYRVMECEQDLLLWGAPFEQLISSTRPTTHPSRKAPSFCSLGGRNAHRQTDSLVPRRDLMQATRVNYDRLSRYIWLVFAADLAMGLHAMRSQAKNLTREPPNRLTPTPTIFNLRPARSWPIIVSKWWWRHSESTSRQLAYDASQMEAPMATSRRALNLTITTRTYYSAKRIKARALKRENEHDHDGRYRKEREVLASHSGTYLLQYCMYGSLRVLEPDHNARSTRQMAQEASQHLERAKGNQGGKGSGQILIVTLGFGRPKTRGVIHCSCYSIIE
ncbi:hypothetical protein AG1IA_06926 [Rhizoctonia solani AG-1 IA]|uniref:Uncharacterized protein n=1 Tax=Thanatephorus cucumeris (strain AG1-IA) TaxID=983506 RepID=L8WM65_THACA|nr:hypothetical protein AG1IA_06926 [Rhizoctonia solani AG-1 IA]